MLRFAIPFAVAVAALCATSALPAATLQQFSIDQLTDSATSIVRARIVSSSASASEDTIYTHYRIQVSETLKGAAPDEFVLAGGVSGHYRQSFPGVPSLATGGEYVLFLWTSSATGLTHPVGLTQGIFDLAKQSDGTRVLSRPRIGEMMLDSSGRRVADQPPHPALSALRTQIRAAVKRSAQ